MENERELKKPDSKKEAPTEDKVSFSSTIKNAHASGDGALERSSEAIDITKDDNPQTEDTNPY